MRIPMTPTARTWRPDRRGGEGRRRAEGWHARADRRNKRPLYGEPNYPELARLLAGVAALLGESDAGGEGASAETITRLNQNARSFSFPLPEMVEIPSGEFDRSAASTHSATRAMHGKGRARACIFTNLLYSVVIA